MRPLALIAILTLAACDDSTLNTYETAAAGGATTAGSTMTEAGGATATQTTAAPSLGGAVAIGGSTSVGGTQAKGGSSAQVTTTARGGASSVATTQALGGAMAAGGTTSAGGASTVGGSVAAGGTATALSTAPAKVCLPNWVYLVEAPTSYTYLDPRSDDGIQMCQGTKSPVSPNYFTVSVTPVGKLDAESVTFGWGAKCEVAFGVQRDGTKLFCYESSVSPVTKQYLLRPEAVTMDFWIVEVIQNSGFPCTSCAQIGF